MTARESLLEAAADLSHVKERAVYAVDDIRQRSLREWSA